MERREDKREPFVANVKIGYFLDDLELCRDVHCDGGKALVPTGESVIYDCPVCQGRGFLPKTANKGE